MHGSTFLSDSDHVLRGRNAKTPTLKINIGGRDGKDMDGKLGQFITKATHCLKCRTPRSQTRKVTLNQSF